jgi:maltose O-acetyltransferase
MTDKEKMLAGDLYNPDDPELVHARRRARELTKALNDSDERQVEERARLIAQLVGSAGEGVRIQPPFYCDYGFNIHLGDSVFFNFNCVVLDTARIEIGSHVMFGPNVQIYAPIHPMNAKERRTWLEASKPVTIGSDVWIGGGAIICPGVTIGDRAVIGAGSVVTRDIPADVFAAGNPCRVIRELG